MSLPLGMMVFGAGSPVPRHGGCPPAAWSSAAKGIEMLDASGTQHVLLAETLGLAMARRAMDILDRHRAALTGAGGAGGAVNQDNDDQFAFDNAIFTAVLDAANECLGRFDTRPADDRWCDALLQVIHLAQLAELTRLSPGGDPRTPGCAAWRPACGVPPARS
jgi:hypothetical protein